MLTIALTTGAHSSHPDFVSNRMEADGDEAPIRSRGERRRES